MIPGILIIGLAIGARAREDGSRASGGLRRARWLHTRLSRRDGMLHYVHMLDMPAASIESFVRLPNDA